MKTAGYVSDVLTDAAIAFVRASREQPFYAYLALNAPHTPRQDRGARGLAKFVRRFRVHNIADQDGIADWMRAEFPGMFHILNKAPSGRDTRDAVFRGNLTGDDR